MAKLSKDLSAGNLHPRESVFTSAAIGSLNAEIIIVADGANIVAIDLRGTFSLTIEVSGTVDGANWTPIPLRPINQASTTYVASVAGTTTGVWAGKCGPFTKVRARCTAYTSGSAITFIVADTAALDDTLNGQITPLIVTTTAAVSTAATLTLPAPGAGLRQYITYMRVTRFAGAVLTAAAAPVIVTTTNLPGSLAFSVEADAAAQGTRATVVTENFSFPLAASAQNTAVTIVAPLTTGVIWRLTAGYYVAP